ncbi:MAG: MBOAT family protein [Lachnospiraceae bacterium]|nr:MBOAT family protein [Lachnospiraceae bacterium]
MLFNSYIFVFVFFPICLFGYYGLLRGGKPGAASVFLTAMSLWFYGYFNLSYLLIMVCSIAGNYLFHRLLSGESLGLSRAGRGDVSGHGEGKTAAESGAALRRAVMVLAVALNLGVLFAFKYFDFFLDTVNGVFGTDFILRGILLPLGISFFTFQQISFIVDTYRGEVADCSLSEYALFVSFFPQLIAGPIVNHGEMLPQFRAFGKKKADWERIAGGLALFVLGLSKKVLLADTFGAGVDYGYGNLTVLGRADAVLVILLYALQLYFDFSGYCDMAVGLGRMLGIEIPTNFNSPYKAVNIVDFWKRWHITLNRFFTKYVYIPLGGNRKGEGRMYLNLLLVFFLSGLWHGAGFHFIVWGMLHGVLYVLTRFWQKRMRTKDDGRVINTVRDKNGAPERCKGMAAQTGSGMSGFGRGVGHKFMTVLSQIATFLYVSVAWVYFRAESIAQANALLRTAWQGEVKKLSMDLAECLQPDEFWYVIKVLRLDNLSFSRYILMFLLLAAGLYFSMVGRNAQERVARLQYGPVSAVALVVLAVWCVLSFSGVSTFLYFNF